MNSHKAIIIPENIAQQLIDCSEGHQHRIVPIQDAEGRYFVSADVLTESQGIFKQIFDVINFDSFEQVDRSEIVMPQTEEE